MSTTHRPPSARSDNSSFDKKLFDLASQAKVKPNKDKSRTYTVTYVPKVEGVHKVKVLFAGQDIDKSPYTVNVAKAMGDPSKVHARGPGLDPVGNVANKPTYFDIYTAGEPGTPLFTKYAA